MIWHLLNRKLDVYRRSTSDDGAGGQESVWAYVATDRFRVSKPNAGEQVTADQAGSRHDHNVFAAPRADVRRGDRLRDAGTAPDSLPYFDVVSVVEPSEPVYRRIECRLVQPEGV